MTNRKTKRLIVICAYIVFFGVLGALIYYVFEPAATCTDGKKNQSENGIDCGGVCAPCKEEIRAQDIRIDEKYFVYGNKNQFDVMAAITNVNNKYGAVKFNYEFQLLDQAGNVLEKRAGTSFVLPDESKYIVELNLHSSINPYRLNFEIQDVQWEEFLEYAEPKLSIYQKNYYEEFEKNIVTGLLRNESNFDFNFIELVMILRDANGKPVALGKSEMRTIKSQEERDFKLIWPYKFSENVANVDIKAEANVFDSDNFIKEYLPSRQFQNYQ
ncbi:MAG: hypothetical protein ACD_7C00019G0002 [uncultured bacterium]|nr:MAG: hypothetical protein ACD_7C00019G0002 [uncultured bacterium]